MVVCCATAVSLVATIGWTVAWPCCSVPGLGFLLLKQDNKLLWPLDLRFLADAAIVVVAVATAIVVSACNGGGDVNVVVSWETVILEILWES